MAKPSKVVYEKWTNGEKVMGSGADKDWVYCELCGEGYNAGAKHICQPTTSPLHKEKSDGSTASYYELPAHAEELQDLISWKNMNAQIGEIFRECYRYGQASHSDEKRGIKKILFYANAELERLNRLGETK